MIPRIPYSPPVGAQTQPEVQAEPLESPTSARRPPSLPSDVPMPKRRRTHAATLPPRQQNVLATRERLAAGIQATHSRLEADMHLLRPEALNYEQLHAELVRNVAAADVQAAARVAPDNGWPLLASDFEKAIAPALDPTIPPLDEVDFGALRRELTSRAKSATSPADTRALHALADDTRTRAEAKHPIATATTLRDAFVPSRSGREHIERMLGQFVDAAQTWSAASEHYRAALQASRLAGPAELATDLEQAAAYCDARAHRLMIQRQVMLGIGQLKRAQGQLYMGFEAAQVRDTEKKVVQILRSALDETRSVKLMPFPLQSHPVEGFDAELGNVAVMARSFLDTANRLASEMLARAQIDPGVMQVPLGLTAPSVELWLAEHSLDVMSLDSLSRASDELIDVAQALRRSLRGERVSVPGPAGPPVPPATSTSKPRVARGPEAGPSSVDDGLVETMASLHLEQPLRPAGSAALSVEVCGFADTRADEARVVRLIERVSPLLQSAAESTASAMRAELKRDKIGGFAAWHDATDAYGRIAGTLALAKAAWTAGTTDAEAVQRIMRYVEDGLRRSEPRMQVALNDVMGEFVQRLRPEEHFGSLAEHCEWLVACIRESAVLQRRVDLHQSVVKRLELLNQVFRTANRPVDDTPHATLEAAERLKALIEATHSAVAADVETSAPWNELPSRIHDLRLSMINAAMESEKKLVMEWTSQVWPHVVSMGHAAQIAASQTHEMLAGDPLPDEGTQSTYLPAPAQLQQQVTAALLVSSSEALGGELPVLPPDMPAGVVTARKTNLKLIEHGKVAVEASSTIVTLFYEAWEALEKSSPNGRPAIAAEYARRVRGVGNEQRQRIAQQPRVSEGLSGHLADSVQEYLATLSFTRRLTEQMGMSLDVLSKVFELQNTARVLRSTAMAMSDQERLKGLSALMKKYEKVRAYIEQKKDRLIAQLTAEIDLDKDAIVECKIVDNFCGYLHLRVQSDMCIVQAKVAIDELKSVLGNVGPDGRPTKDLAVLSALAERTNFLLTNTSKVLQKQATVPSNKERVKFMLNLMLPTIREIQDIKVQIARLQGAGSSSSAATPMPEPRPRSSRQDGSRGAAGRRR